jgi:hypothetical protein
MLSWQVGLTLAYKRQGLLSEGTSRQRVVDVCPFTQTSPAGRSCGHRPMWALCPLGRRTSKGCELLVLLLLRCW